MHTTKKRPRGRIKITAKLRSDPYRWIQHPTTVKGHFLKFLSSNLICLPLFLLELHLFHPFLFLTAHLLFCPLIANHPQMWGPLSWCSRFRMWLRCTSLTFGASMWSEVVLLSSHLDLTPHFPFNSRGIYINGSASIAATNFRGICLLVHWTHPFLLWL